MNKTFIEFFAGVGLIHEALAQLGWTAVFANDNDPKKVKTYKANYPDVPFDDRSITDISVKGLPPIDLATASFPCIDVSQAGNREGINGKHSGLVWTFLERVRDLKEDGNAPRFLLLENVPNLLTIDDGKSVDFLLNQISELGYAVDIVQVDAVHFTPQSRNRLFIIGVAERDYSSITGEYDDHHIRRYRVRETISRNAALRWHFFDFHDLPSRKLSLNDIIEPLSCDDARWWDEKQLEYFWDLVERDHKTKLHSLLNSGKSFHFTAVRRLRRRHKREQIFNVRFDGLASCLRTPKGGSSTQYIIEIEAGELRGRRILGVEAARLQGVALPNSAPGYHVPQSQSDALFGFGDAVCVPAVKWVVEHSIERLITDQVLATRSIFFPTLETVN